VKRWFAVGAALALATLGCASSETPVVVITATFLPPTAVVDQPTTAAPAETTPLPATAPPAATAEATALYIVQPGDTLTAIALAHNTTVDTLRSLNALLNPDLLEVGQALQVPPRPTRVGPADPLLPNALLVRGPQSTGFDAVAYAQSQPGWLRDFREEVDGVEMTGPDIVERVSRDFGIDARVLLALLEYRARALTAREPAPGADIYPVFQPLSLTEMGRTGLYRQLNWAADRLNGGYYGRKYRGLDQLELPDGARLLIDESVQPGTAALQSMFSKMLPDAEWTRAVSPAGFLATYRLLFFDPLDTPMADPLDGMSAQPALALPFSNGETWFYTGGPHGGWGSGSAWAAIDFAPPDDPATVDTSCYVSAYFVTAAADGVVARSGDGAVVLDLDGDGDETTGWTVFYLHLDTRDRAAEGSRLRAGDPVGRASCEGGVSNGTHVHIARRYNGEWLPASCSGCSGTQTAPGSFVLGGWEVVGLPGQEYQGYLINGGETRVAEAARGVAPNEVGS
jgi:murein DD-endopeptidase MepM/ murein hydrolase activator NlpD